MNPIETASVAELQAVVKNYGSVAALRGVDLSIRRGEILGLLGPNGAGKTTLVTLLLGLATPSTGRVQVFGNDPRRPETRMRIGAMLQVGRVPETLRVREHIDLFSSYYPRPLRLQETIEWAGLQGLGKRPFGELSGGQKQRLLFALAICGNPDLLILDEPTVGLDVEARRALWERIRALARTGKTVLLTTHYLQEADALSDRVVVLNRGQIVAQGSPAEIKRRTLAKRIRCVSSLTPDQVRAIAGVADVMNSDGHLEIHTQEPEKVVRELMLRDARIADLEIASAALEDAFLALTAQDQTAATSGMEAR